MAILNKFCTYSNDVTGKGFITHADGKMIAEKDGNKFVGLFIVKTYSDGTFWIGAETGETIKVASVGIN